MIYNTNEEKLRLSGYGRTIQNMVDYALTIQDRKERQNCAETIVMIMERMFPKLKEQPDYKHKLWDHLAIMSDFKLDIDYPFDIVKPDNLASKPEKINHEASKIRYRYYGRTLEHLIKQACEMPDGNEKNNLLALICNHMFKSYTTWNSDTVDIYKIDADLNELSGGKLYVTDDLLQLMDVRNDYYEPEPMEEGKGTAASNAKKKKKKKKNN